MNQIDQEMVNDVRNCAKILVAAGKLAKQSDDSIRDAVGGFLSDFSRFLCFLSAADGKISSSERYIVNSFLEAVIENDNFYESNNAIIDYIKNNKLQNESGNFASSLPSIFKIITTLDKLQKNNKQTNLSWGFYNLYLKWGEALIEADGVADENEKRRLKTYLDRIENYINSELPDA